MILPRLKVTPQAYEPPFRWLVPSGSRPGEKHLVELNAYGVNGRCSCADFTCRHEPGLRADPTTGGVDKTRCKHIRAVRQHFLDGILREMSKGLKVLALFLCGLAQAEPSPAFLDALAWAETRNRSIEGDNGEALGPFQFHLAAWLDADHHRQLSGLPRADYQSGARCPATARAYAHTLLTVYEVRLRDRGLAPTAERLWLCWTMGFNGAKRIGFKASNAPAYKRRGLARLTQHLSGSPAVYNSLHTPQVFPLPLPQNAHKGR